jgi:hypothetical protein
MLPAPGSMYESIEVSEVSPDGGLIEYRHVAGFA